MRGRSLNIIPICRVSEKTVEKTGFLDVSTSAFTRPPEEHRLKAGLHQGLPVFSTVSQVYAACCTMERLSHSLKCVGARRAFLPGVRL